MKAETRPVIGRKEGHLMYQPFTKLVHSI